MIKYGVVSTQTFLSDLQNWNTFYWAGRFQKPVIQISNSIIPSEIKNAMYINRLNAMKISLTMLPKSFTRDQLLQQIVGLSYKGDPRVGIAEDPQKIQKIVQTQQAQLIQIYKPIGEQLNISFDSEAVSYCNLPINLSFIENSRPS